MGVADAAASGDRRQALEAVRDRLAQALEDVEDRYAGPIARQLRDVLAELAQLPDAAEVSAVDDLASARAKRRSQKRSA